MAETLELTVGQDRLKAMMAFVQRQVRDGHSHVRGDRRAEPRSSVVVPVKARAVNPQFKPIGPTFNLVSRDLSPKGIGLVHDYPIACDLLALQMQLNEEEINLVIRQRWIQDLGPFYYVGGEVVAKLDAFPGGEHG